MNKHIAIIGSGISSLSAASIAAKEGYPVTIFEKNVQLGGRMRHFDHEGFRFDMGPSWYWMPDVFEKYYNLFGYTTSDLYNLKKLDPGFQIIFNDSETFPVPASWEELNKVFESIEKGSSKKLEKFIQEAKIKYDLGINEFVYKPGLSWFELLNFKTLKQSLNLQLFTSFSKHVRSFFKDERLIALIEFPVLFLGTTPATTPALYSLMNYSALKQGTFYPMGGFSKVVDAMVKIAKEQGVNFETSAPISSVLKEDEKIKLSYASDKSCLVDAVIAGADYQHVETKLLKKNSNYKPSYWDNKVLSPSSLIFYLGVDKKVSKLEHHNLFFDENFDLHAKEIYDDPKWPSKPLFYVCCPSKTDDSVAPIGKENLFILMPIAPDLKDDEAVREKYFDLILDRLEKFCGESIREKIVFKRSYCVTDFKQDYNSFKGNAYGLANTLMQTANLKPSLKNKNIENFYYTGQLTVPGPGVPSSLISGQVSANELIKNLKKYNHETAV